MADVAFTDANFDQEVLKAAMPVMVDFWAPWCQPCKMVGPTIEALAVDYAGKVKVGKMNVDENAQIPGQFGIMGIPTVILFQNGQPVKSFVGVQAKETYKVAIEEVLK
ncbi:MAG TPA: thioredoxin [Patescibacteria group bacterium]|nr:thioredoxin [Patescibacteria group bacterium]